jgi:serine/threonine protein phosphatase PrpC
LLTPEITNDRSGFGVCRCGASPDAIDESGFCTECGVRRTVQLDGSRDHKELCLSEFFVGVTDRGIRHKDNQDDLAIRIVETVLGGCNIVVVCDGVSGSEGAANASAAAAKTACEYIERGIASGLDEALILAAIRDANQAVNLVSYNRTTTKDPPETTIVAAVAVGSKVIIGWAGDSRAYWYTDNDAAMLTRDHSWVNDAVSNGIMTEEEALLSPLAHAIVCSLGGAYENFEPSVITSELPKGATLLLCSDGLWNYVPSVEELAALIHERNNERPLETARRLVQFAVGNGGKDNITVALLKT